MKSCETHETQVSAWLDGELERADQVEVLDHLVRCASCRGFYTDARALDGALATVRAPRDVEQPSAETWQRIERAAELGQDARRRPAIPTWALRAAAAVLLAVGVGGLFWKFRPATAPPPEDAIIALGEASGQMTEDRFIELTREILRAEPRYRNAMYRVMHQVVQDTTTLEAAAEYESGGATGGEQPVAETLGREPV